MKVQPAVRTETLKIAVGTALLSLVMIAVFALVKQLTLSVWLGALLGTATAILYFFLMALSVQKAAARMDGVKLPDEELDENGNPIPTPEAPEVKRAKQGMQLSYYGRMLMLVAVAVLALSLQNVFNPIAVAIPLLFPRIIVSIMGLFQSKRKGEA